MDELVCQEFVEIVTDYLENTLPERERRRVEAHLLTCAGCREYLEQMRTMLRLTGRLSVDALSEAARNELLRAFRQMKASSSL